MAAELRRLRENAGISLDQAATMADLAKSTLSRMETAQIGTRPLTVRALMTIYGIPEPEAESLVQLARDARKVGWWQAYSNVIPSQHGDYIALESEAAVIHSYEPQLVPGLLQTERYARELIRTDLTPMSSEDLERKVALRAVRKGRLTQVPVLEFWAIIDEMVLRRPIGSAKIMAEQRTHLLEMARLPNVTLQVLPLDAGAHAGLVGSFSIIESPDPHFPDVAYVDCVAGQMFLEKPEEIRRTKLLINHLRTKALDTQKSIKVIAAILDAP